MFDIGGKKKRIAELDDQTGAEGFWNAADKAQTVLREQARLKSSVESFEAQLKTLEDADVLIEMADEAKDEATAVEAAGTLSAIEEAVSKIEFARMLSGPYDRQGALVSVNAGAGGTESQDWAAMLMRMYARWAERKGFKLEELDRQPGDEAGIKSATIGVEGEWAYGWLRAEAGVHRLVRISPFDGQARRHTSFASVFIYPDIDETIKVEIDEKDLRIDVMRSGGAGGQHVNKTESAVRVTHI
ncbi:MAG TPA: PCRF domain-containing protein, partial [Polyangia bacterium]|nr:PCRF domain-containing protein [Polyangia bacterium]